MAGRQFKVAAAQLTAGEDLAANLAVCASLAQEAASRGAQVLVLPECFAFLGRNEKAKLAVAEVIDEANPGPILGELGRIARAHHLWVIAGGMPERKPDEPAPAKVYNTCVVLDDTGALVAAYRKVHLFDVDIPGGAQLRESDSTHAGRDLHVVPTPFAKIGLSICYDLRFPELYRRLVDDGAELIVVPSAFTAHTGAAHWHVLLRARAIENQCWVVAAAQTGRHNEKRESYGHSLIIDPWGAIVAEQASGVGLAVAEIDLDTLDRTRRQMPCLTHRVLE